MKRLIVIPAFNKEPQVAGVVARAQEAKAIVVRSQVNGGKGKAITTGFEYAVREVRITTIYGDEVSKINPWIETFRFIRLFVLAFLSPAGQRRQG